MKKIKIWTAPGIGDICWILTKIPDMRRKLNPDHVEIVVQNTEFNRSDDFLIHFDFVDSVSYDNFDILPESQYMINPLNPKELVVNPSDSEGYYVYNDSTDNFMNDPNSWLLLANSHLEHGNRLEDWYIESGFENDIDLEKYWNFRDEEIEFASKYHRDILDNHPFIVFYLGPFGGNTTAGHNMNGLWSLYDWYKVAELCYHHNRRNKLKFVIVGAKQDWQYANLFMGSGPKECMDKSFINLCGQTSIGECYALILRSRFILSYQSGIGIFSAYLGHPSSVFYRPYGNSFSPDYYVTYDEKFSHCWCPKDYINKTYFPLIYTKNHPKDIAEKIFNFL